MRAKCQRVKKVGQIPSLALIKLLVVLPVVGVLLVVAPQEVVALVAVADVAKKYQVQKQLRRDYFN